MHNRGYTYIWNQSKSIRILFHINLYCLWWLCIYFRYKTESSIHSIIIIWPRHSYLMYWYDLIECLYMYFVLFFLFIVNIIGSWHSYLVYLEMMYMCNHQIIIHVTSIWQITNNSIFVDDVNAQMTIHITLSSN